MTKEILIEGYTRKEILAFPAEQIEQLILTGEALVFKAGSASVLGEFRIEYKRLVIELAQIEGGGEGVLSSLWLLVLQYAKQQSLEETEWIIHAINCANPNAKLRPFLERRGFQIQNVSGVGEAYYLLYRVT
jgi:hypothetical protein